MTNAALQTVLKGIIFIVKEVEDGQTEDYQETT